jgi:SAM-dependent methyltransferase
MQDHRDTIGAYNKFADIYDQEVIDFWANFPRDFLQRFVKATPGKRILNVGSGSGRDALLLRDLGLDVTCQDGSQSMVDMTTNLGFESHLLDFHDINFPTSSFDGVWAYTSLIHIPVDEIRQVIANLRTMLKPDGSFAIGVIEGNESGMVQRKTMLGSQRYFKNYTSQELRNLVQQLGFELVCESTYQPNNKVYINQLYRKY